MVITLSHSLHMYSYIDQPRWESDSSWTRVDIRHAQIDNGCERDNLDWNLE